MKCYRCHGMMAREVIWTYQGKVAMARCLYCGNVIDPVVMANRNRSRAFLAMMIEREALEEKTAFQEAGAFSLRGASTRRRVA